MSAAAAPPSLAIPTLVRRSWAGYRSHFGLYLAATAVAQLPTGLVAWFAGYGASAALDAMRAATLPEVRDVGEVIAALLAMGADRFIGFGLLLVVSAVLHVIGTVLSAGALAYLLAAVPRPGTPAAACRPDAAPGPPTLGAAYRAVFARLGPLFGAIVLAGVIICAVLLAVCVIWVLLTAAQLMLAPAGEAPPAWVQAGLSLLLVGLTLGALVYAVYAFTRWALFIQAVVLEDRGPADALRRSAALLRGRWWHTAVLLTLFAVVQSALGALASGALSALLGGAADASVARLVSGLGLLVINVVYFPLAANALTLLYFGLRAREPAAAGRPA